MFVDVGYNDFSSGYAEGLDEVMAALVAAGVERVGWITLEEFQGTWKEINDVIRAAPLRWPQLTVVDWAAVSGGKPWFVDIAHMNEDGALPSRRSCARTWSAPAVRRAARRGSADLLVAHKVSFP